MPLPDLLDRETQLVVLRYTLRLTTRKTLCPLADVTRTPAARHARTITVDYTDDESKLAEHNEQAMWTTGRPLSRRNSARATSPKPDTTVSG